MGLPQIARSRRWNVFVDDTADEVPVICVPVVDSAMVLLDMVRFSAPLLPPPPSGLALPSDILRVRSSRFFPTLTLPPSLYAAAWS